jgi:hypothetical protein
MKNTSKILLILGAVVILSLSAFPVNAIGYSVSFDDAQGDVRDDDGNPTSESNVDITHVKSYKEGQTLYLELTVAGSIMSSEEYVYMLDVGGEGADVIQAVYSNGSAHYFDQLNPQNSGEAEYTIDNNKLTIEVPVGVFSSEHIALRANAAKSGDMETEAIDMAPNDGGFSAEDAGDDDTGDEDTGDEDTGDGDTGNGDTGGDESEDTNGGTPGFETIVVLGALGIAVIILRKRK